MARNSELTGAIANLSCTSPIVVKVAIRTAKAEELITVERTGRRSTTTISPTWKAWLSRYGDAPSDGPRRQELVRRGGRLSQDLKG